MMQPKTLEEKIQQLKDQNSELVNTAQFWRMQYKRSEDEKLGLLKENNEITLRKKQYYNKIKGSCDLLQEFACRLIEDVLQFSAYVENIGGIISEFDGNYDSMNRETSTSNYTPGGSPSNVHHVRPMIGGVTLKTPVLKVSRANLNVIKRTVRTLKNDIIAGNSPEMQSPHRQSPLNTKMQRVSVCLRRMEGVDKKKTNVEKQSNQSDSSQSQVESPSNISLEGVRPVRHDYILNDVSVSLRRIDDNKMMLRNKSQQENNDSDKANNTTNELKNSQEDSSQDSEMENKENIYNDEEFNNEYQTSGCIKYSRLECIPEETDNNLSESKTSPHKIAQKETISFNRSTISKDKDSEDPLEGPSWLFDKSKNNTPLNVSSRKSSLNFVTARKREKPVPDESLFETSSIPKDFDQLIQLPDSTTTDLKENTIDNIENNPWPQCQSTPNLGSVTKTGKVIDNNVEMENSFHLITENVVLKTKVIKDKKSKSSKDDNKTAAIKRSKTAVRKRTSKEKGNAVRIRKSSCNKLSPLRGSKELPKITSKPILNSVPSVNDNSSSSLDNNTSDNVRNRSRPKRAVTKDYKELGLNKKLRRS